MGAAEREWPGAAGGGRGSELALPPGPAAAPPGLAAAPVNLLLGCSGWSYPEWCGRFYPEGTHPSRMLPLYARVFPAVEVNSTFYRPPPAAMVRRWLERTPASFTFAAKLPQAITHERRLEGCWRELEGFLALMRPLTEAGRLAALLAQLPPSFDRGCLPALEGFLEGFPEGPRLAVELRHRSWYEGRRLRPEVRSLLARHRAAAAVVSSPLMETEAEATTDLAYVRWHGLDPKTWYSYRYRREELAAWAEPVRALCTGTGVVLAFFNNHPHAYAPENCRELAAMLGARLGSMVPGQRTLLGGQ